MKKKAAQKRMPKVWTRKKRLLTPWESTILRMLLQDHLNTVSELSNWIDVDAVKYLDRLRGLELFLQRCAGEL